MGIGILTTILRVGINPAFSLRWVWAKSWEPPVPHQLHNAYGKKFCRSAVGAQRYRAGALAGAALRIVGRSAPRSGAPEIELERALSGAPDFAGALILCLHLGWIIRIVWMT